MIKNVKLSPCIFSVILALFQLNLNFLDSYFQKYSYIKFHEKSVQWEQSYSMRTDRYDELAFRNFANAPENYPVLVVLYALLFFHT